MSIICGNILITTILVKTTFLNNHNISSVYQVADGLFTKDNSQAGRLNRSWIFFPQDILGSLCPEFSKDGGFET